MSPEAQMVFYLVAMAFFAVAMIYEWVQNSKPTTLMFLSAGFIAVTFVLFWNAVKAA